MTDEELADEEDFAELTRLAAEATLCEIWDTPEEDAAWQTLNVRQSIEAGLKDSKAGLTLSIEKVRAKLGLPPTDKETGEKQP